MDELEKEVIRLRIQIKHNTRKLIENTKWNQSLESLLIGNGIFDVNSINKMKEHLNPVEKLYEEIHKRGYNYRPTDVHTVLNLLSMAFKETENVEAAKILNLMIHKTSYDRIPHSETSENIPIAIEAQRFFESDYKIYNVPDWNDSIDWTILSKRIIWNKKLEKKLSDYNLLDSDILHRTGFPKEKTENLYKKIRKISFRLVPNIEFKRLYNKVVKILIDSGNYKAASILDLSGSIREISSIKKKPSGRLHSPTQTTLSPNPNREIELYMPNSPTPLRSKAFRARLSTTSDTEADHLEVHSPEIDDDIDPELLISRKPLRIKVKKANKLMIPPTTCACYPMTSKPRGFALIINNEIFNDPSEIYSTRHGSTIDANNLCILFQQLGFQSKIKENREYQDLQDDIDDFAQLKENVEPNMRILVVLSHGDKMNVLSADGFKLPYEWIISRFNNCNCPQLRGKPKLFIFPACRGASPDYGVYNDLSSSPTQFDSSAPDASVVMKPSPLVSRSGKRLPMYSDILIAYGTLPGYVANRDTAEGSWYIQCFCKVLMKKAGEMELMEMLAEISREMLEYESEFGTVQTCSYEVRGCFDKLYFNPGL
jgi:hypothetical protein